MKISAWFSTFEYITQQQSLSWKNPLYTTLCYFFQAFDQRICGFGIPEHYFGPLHHACTQKRVTMFVFVFVCWGLNKRIPLLGSWTQNDEYKITF